MTTDFAIPVDRLNRRREALGMSVSALAERSGVSEAAVKRILGGRAPEASYAHVMAIAGVLGVAVGGEEVGEDELLRREARAKAERVARLVQGTSALESQAVDRGTYERLVERSYHELLAGSRRRLWSA